MAIQFCGSPLKENGSDESIYFDLFNTSSTGFTGNGMITQTKVLNGNDIIVSAMERGAIPQELSYLHIWHWHEVEIPHGEHWPYSIHFHR